MTGVRAHTTPGLSLALALSACAAAPANAAAPTALPEAAAATDAATDAGHGAAATPSDAAPVAAPACLPKLQAEIARRVGSTTPLSSAENVRARLASFGVACAGEFPEWAAAATRASKLGRAGRRRVFAEVVKATCPAVASAASAKDVVAACPAFVGASWDGAAARFLELADPGTFAFCTFMLQHGFGALAEELALQSTLHPEWDP